ncbi:MAG: PLDc N-terminal domain-containing protein [Granulosicoccus sp.]
MSIEVSGFFGVIWLIATIWAIVRTIQSNASTAKKTIWIVFILLLPLFGLIAWFFFGPKG